MPALQFTRDLAIAILEGRKVQTLRGTLPGRLELGGRLTMLNGYRAGNVFGHSTVTAFDLVAVRRLTAADARRDGFDTLEALLARLDAMKRADPLWRIRWRDFAPTPDGQDMIDDVPRCLRKMGCLCWKHAQGAPAGTTCNTTEKRYRHG